MSARSVPKLPLCSHHHYCRRLLYLHDPCTQAVVDFLEGGIADVDEGCNSLEHDVAHLQALFHCVHRVHESRPADPYQRIRVLDVIWRRRFVEQDQPPAPLQYQTGHVITRAGANPATPLRVTNPTDVR
jgi:hypothetical protein